MKLILLGAPGAGKGTQAALIADRYSIPHISTGDIFRANIKAGTPLGVKAKEYIDCGKLVPDELTIGLLMDRVAQDDCKDGYILDGFPRTIPQAEKLDEALRAASDKLDAVIDIECNDEFIIKRMAGRRVCPGCGATYHVTNIPPKKEGICDKCGKAIEIRKDDEPETVKARLATYHEQTEPLIKYYGDQKLIVTIDGEQGLQETFDDIVKALG